LKLILQLSRRTEGDLKKPQKFFLAMLGSSLREVRARRQSRFDELPLQWLKMGLPNSGHNFVDVDEEFMRLVEHEKLATEYHAGKVEPPENHSTHHFLRQNSCRLRVTLTANQLTLLTANSREAPGVWLLAKRPAFGCSPQEQR
jgi:hypothetical protein